MDPSPFPTLAEIAASLEKNRGNLSKCSRDLSVRRKNLVERIGKHPDLQAVLDEIRDERIDKAEDNIYDDLDKGDPAASRFVLATLGKDRGWVTRNESTGKGGGDLSVTIKKFSDAPEGDDSGEA